MLKKAFSLIELMVTLVVVSILTAAMAPVITKRLKSKEITIAQGGGGLTMNCFSISPQCGLCEGDVCVSCAKSCTENEALDIPNCNCKLCNSADFHGEACLRCDMENCSKCINGYYLTSGICTLCTDGYSCDGTNQNPCPAGYYCKDGVTTACSAGTYNDTTGATNESACVACSNKTANCTNCDIATGVCNTCESGYEIASGECKSKEFTYTYTGTHIKDTLSEYTRIVLKSSGTFTSLSEASGTVMVLGGGGGGGGGGSTAAGPRNGCAGYNNQSELVFTPNSSWSVTIGGGGGGGGGNKNQWTSWSGGYGGSSTFGALTGAGGQGGSGWTNNVYECSGGSAFTFAGISYASGCSGGANTGTGGCKGAQSSTGSAGSSGVVSIMIPRT